MAGRPSEPGRTPGSRPAPQRKRRAESAAAPEPVGRGRSAKARRTREATEVTGTTGRTATFAFRHRTGGVVILLALMVAAAQLFNLQVPRRPALRAQAAGQPKVTDVEKAVRGSIVDRNDDKLAFTVEARALTFQPAKIRKQLTEAKQKSPAAPDPDKRLMEIARDIAGKLNNKPDYQTLLKKLRGNDTFVYLARAVDPAVAGAITKKFPEVGAERQDLRQYPAARWRPTSSARSTGTATA